MNANDETPNSGEHLESEKKLDQPLSRCEKIISAGLVAAVALLWGVYGPGLMKDSWVEKWMDTSLGVAVLFIVCMVWSCVVMIARTRREEKNEPPRWRTSRLWAAAPWLITLPLLLTMNFQWQALMSGFWVLLALLIVLWEPFAKGEPQMHPVKEDKIGRGLMYSRFGDKIRIFVGKKGEDEEERGLSIAVTGEWGSGKSHFINATVAMLEAKYQTRDELYRERLPDYAYKGKFVAANVDLWQASSVESMWQDVAQALLYMLNGYDAGLDSILKKIMGALLSFIPFHITSETKDVMRLIATGGDPYTIPNKLYKRFQKAPVRYILVMDNIDRCDEKIQRNVFSLIERLNQVPHLVVICGIAKGDIATAISDGSPSLRAALLKVFDVQVPMPQLMKQEASDYLYNVLGNIKIDCPNFKTWCQYQDFSSTTPRHLERIASRLSLIDNMYLMRNSGDSSILEYDPGKSEPNNTIFCFEAMRAIYPEIVFPYADPPSQDGGKNYSKWQGYIKRDYCDDNDKTKGNCPRCVLPKMAKHLCDDGNRWIYYIANQDYLRISALTDKECECLLDDYKAGTNPIKAVDNAFAGAFHPKNVGNLVKCVCWYCLSHPGHRASLLFVEALCANRLDINIFPHYTVTNIIVLMQFELVERSRWQACLQSIIRTYPIEWLTEEVGKIVDYIGKIKERLEIRSYLSSRLTRTAKDILDKYGQEGENSDKLKQVADQLLQEYAKKACAFILDSPSLNDYGMYKHMMIGQSVSREIYEGSLKKGVQEFLNSDASIKYRQKVGEYMRRLLRSIIIRSHDSETLELTDMPFAVLSFAVIWSNLCLGLIKQGELMKNLRPIVGKRLAAIKTRVEKDAKMSKEEKQSKGSEQLWRNRETAMSILGTTLERLKKQANE